MLAWIEIVWTIKPSLLSPTSVKTCWFPRERAKPSCRRRFPLSSRSSSSSSSSCSSSWDRSRPLFLFSVGSSSSSCSSSWNRSRRFLFSVGSSVNVGLAVGLSVDTPPPPRIGPVVPQIVAISTVPSIPSKLLQ